MTEPIRKDGRENLTPPGWPYPAALAVRPPDDETLFRKGSGVSADRRAEAGRAAPEHTRVGLSQSDRTTSRGGGIGGRLAPSTRPRVVRQPVGRRVVPAADLAATYAVSMGPAGVLLSSPLACQDVLAALEGAIRAQQRDTGVAVRPEVIDLRDVLARHVTECRVRQSAVPPEDDSAPWEPAERMTVADAADLLGVHERQVRNLAGLGQISGRKVGGVWQLDTAAVLAAVDDRKGHR